MNATVLDSVVDYTVACILALPKATSQASVIISQGSH
jgi:hypothetical protein